ncbi:MAG: glycosyltransferase family 4 protein [Candidatus Binataceae bacterium]
MRLLHVHSGNLYGGVETMLSTIARCGEAEPLEHEFALCFDGRLATELRALGAPLHWLGAAQTRRPLSILRARRRLRDLLRGRRCDAAVCHMPWAQALFGRIVRARGIPLIFWMHEAATGHRHWLERWARRTRPDFVVCNSDYTAATLPRLYPCAPHEVMYPPVALAPGDAARRNALRRHLGTPADAIVIMQVSRVQPGKGHFVHLEALSRLRDLPGWVCWIVGGAQRRADAQLLAALAARAAELGIADRVRFCGERTDVPDLLSAADIFCQPNTRAEPFGIVFVEALGAGLPVVTAGVGGALEIVDSSCGLSVPPNDPGRLAAALRQVIEDASLRARLGNAGPARAATLCDPRARLAQLSAIIARLAGECR